MKKVPRSFERVLWSYHIGRMDMAEDKRQIIPQVLNYGTWKELKLLFKYYSEADIKAAVSHPRRGVWFERVLNFWTKMYGIRLRKDVYQKAIVHLCPHDDARFYRF